MSSAATASNGGAPTSTPADVAYADSSSRARSWDGARADPDGRPLPPDDGARLETRVLRVAIADDHLLMLDGISRALETDPGIKVVGKATTGDGLVALVPRIRPDVVILDMRMPGGDGLATIKILRKSHPDLKIIMLSVFDDPVTIETALGYGAAGYVVKSINPLDLPSTVRAVFEGTVYQPGGNRGATGTIDRFPHTTPDGLTIRELAVLKLVAEGLPSTEIARKLFVTEQTVKFHLTNTYRKLGVGNRTEATRYAYTHSLVD